MKYALLAWLQFTIGLVVLGLWDYYIRWRDGWLGEEGLPTPDSIWFGVPLVLGMIATALLWRATSKTEKLWARFGIVGLQVFVGFAVYMAACLWYVIGTGVDAP